MTALERESTKQALDRLPVAFDRVAILRRRFAPLVDLRPGARVLDIGAALGLHLAAWNLSGYEAVGVEPWPDAVSASREIERETGASFEIVQGEGENLPFPDDSFDLITAISVLEHTRDPERVFEEAHRVLRPSGAFYFSTTSAICPRQSEIRVFVGFPWYPDRLRKRIMRWAAQSHPWLVNGTSAPAYHWFTPASVNRSLQAAGFSQVIDRWALRRDEEETGMRLRIARAARENAAVRFAADLLVEGSAYLALA